MKKYIFLAFCCVFSQNQAEQFIYPVANFHDSNQLMVMYQKSLNSIELWIWDTTTKQAIKGLSSFFIPANLRMMPSGNGFSFIDQGYIKIKEFVKRSPRTLSIYEPIGLFSNMEWIDEENFYFVAREGDFFQIFQGDLQGNILRLTHDFADALYPQKVGSTLFYMQRDMQNQISIIMEPWNPKSMDLNSNQTEESTVILQHVQQGCFLHMISETEGFYVQAPTKKGKDSACYQFNCHHIKKYATNWKNERIFGFDIPSHYITGSTKLYESLEPFLPNFQMQETIYFTTWNHESEQFEIWNYNLAAKTLTFMNEQILYRKDNQQFFAPYIHDGVMHCGLIITNQRNIDSLQYIFEMNNVEFELPYSLIK